MRVRFLPRQNAPIIVIDRVCNPRRSDMNLQARKMKAKDEKLFVLFFGSWQSSLTAWIHPAVLHRKGFILRRVAGMPEPRRGGARLDGLPANRSRDRQAAALAVTPFRAFR